MPVEEHLVFDNAIYPASTSSVFYKTATLLSASMHNQISSEQARPKPCRIVQPSVSKELKDPLINSVVSLAIETARTGYGALVFCSSRVGCERDATLISLAMPRPTEADQNTIDKRSDLIHSLQTTSVGLDHVLEKTIPQGVAYHRMFPWSI